LEPIHCKVRCHLTLGIDCLAGDKVHAVLGQAEEEPVNGKVGAKRTAKLCFLTPSGRFES
jgi:hypothetical protein